MEKKLQEICAAFGVSGTFAGYEELKNGNINRTFRVDYREDDGTLTSYITQRVNTYVFKRPVEVMSNIDGVTRYIAEKYPNRTNLHFFHTISEDLPYVEDVDGFWRLFNFVHSIAFNSVESLDVIRGAGEAFGEFQLMLAPYDASTLYETIPGFHDTRDRYEKLIRVVEEDKMGRKAEVEDELAYLFSVQDLACHLTDMYRAGELPLRVTHNDTKLNNVLFNKETLRPEVVIDLDTVMPGLVGHDFGDAIRFAGNFVAEDSPEYDKVGVNLEVFRAFADGFLSQTAKTLTQAEIDTLALSCFVLAAEEAVRFVDDYIQGDPYFKILYPEHNLVRTRNQVALSKALQAKLPEMEAIIREIAAQYR